VSFWETANAETHSPAFSDGRRFVFCVKLPRDISGGETVKALRRLGFAVTRQEGSHIRMSKGGLHVTIPNHKAIAVGTLKSILRQAGVSVEEFVAKL
jgi:predicted RNA binding protein YcfA (HicA-like mRNA interferase family)